MRARSTAASVWPARTSTPPSRARSGNMWPGPREIGRTRRRIDRGQHRGRAIARRDAGRRAALRLDRHAERRAERRAVLRAPSSGISSSSSRSPVIGRQIEPAAVRGHEVDGLGRDLLGGDRQIALVLAILVVDDDDHLPGADRVDRVLDGRERRATCSRVWPAAGASSWSSYLRRRDRAVRRLDAQEPRDVLAEHVGLELTRSPCAQLAQASCARA